MSNLSTLRNKTVQLFIVAAAQIFSISCLVHAEIPAESKPGVISLPWELYDTDKDDYISAEEAAQQKMPAETFKSLDIDRDGRLNKDEFSKAPPIKMNYLENSTMQDGRDFQSGLLEHFVSSPVPG